MNILPLSKTTTEYEMRTVKLEINRDWREHENVY